ncbi:gas vesicle protein GvpM [Halomarina salina]|uniref:Gas vesicle protein GvpM n=1 Tax=Halomarina salina TaxID=1872699 RepID=A0ABD5RQ83_9EURY|nr:gas vesicle protein [Halomarina salina]
MKPRRGDDAVVDLLDVILRDGVVLQADVIISVAEIPLVGLQLRAALAGMDTMTEYGLLTDWDEETRTRAVERESGQPTRIE